MWTYIILIIYSKLDLKTCLEHVIKNVAIIKASLFQFAAVFTLDNRGLQIVLIMIIMMMMIIIIVVVRPIGYFCLN